MVVFFCYRCKGSAAMFAPKLPDIDLTTKSKQGPRKLFGFKKSDSKVPSPIATSGQNVKQLPSKDAGFLAMVGQSFGALFARKGKEERVEEIELKSSFFSEDEKGVEVVASNNQSPGKAEGFWFLYC